MPSTIGVNVNCQFYGTKREARWRKRRHAAQTHGATLVEELRGPGGRVAPRRVAPQIAQRGAPPLLSRGRPQTPAVAAVRTAWMEDIFWQNYFYFLF